MGAPFIAAAIRRANHEIIDQLRAAGATSRATAQPLPPVHRLAERRLERLMAADVVRQAAPGQYYLDEEEYSAYRRRRMTIALTLVVTMFVLGVVMMRWTIAQAR